MKRLTSRGAGVLIAGLALASTACAYGIVPATASSGPHDPGGAVHLNVTNNSGGPMEVYAAAAGTSYRIGTVHPGLAGHFVVRPAMVVNGPVEFMARTGRGRLVRSGLIMLAAGDEVDFRLEAHPVMSNATLRPRL